MATQSKNQKGPSKAAVQRAYQMLNNPDHYMTRVAIARTYRDIMSTMNDPHSRRLLAAANELIAEAEGTSKRATA